MGRLEDLAARRALARHKEWAIARCRDELERAHFLKKQGNFLFPVQLAILDASIQYNTKKLDTLTNQKSDTMNLKDEIVRHKALLEAFYNKLAARDDGPSVNMGLRIHQWLQQMDTMLAMCDIQANRPWPGCCGQCMSPDQCERREKDAYIKDLEDAANERSTISCGDCGTRMKMYYTTQPGEADRDTEAWYCPQCDTPF